MSSASSRSFSTESMKYSKPGWPFRWEMLSIDPVDRSSRTRTSWPSASSRSERCEPMNPAPPVISARTFAALSYRERAVHGSCDAGDVGRAHPRMQGQRQHALAEVGRMRTRSAPERRKGGLTWNGNGIVNQGLDAVGREPRLKRRAIATEHRKEMIHVPGVELPRHGDAVSRQRLAITPRQRAPRRGGGRQPGEARAKHGSLQFVEPRVHAELRVVIAIGLAAVAQPRDPLGQLPIACQHRAPVAERAEVLRRVEAERRRDPER